MKSPVLAVPGAVLSGLCGLLISFNVAAAEALTQQSLQKMVQEMEKAAVKRDVAGVLKYMSPEVRIVVTVKTPQGPQTVPMDYETYKASLREGWAMAKDYTYQREKMDIKIAPNQKEATITAVIRETLVMDAGSMSTVARETSTVKLVNGKPMVVKVYAEQLE